MLPTGPLPRVRRVLEEHRRGGTGFTVAWARAVESVDDPDWVEVLRETRSAWRAAYYRTPPTTVEVAIQLIGTDPLTGLWVEQGDGRELCALCRRLIPVERYRAGRPPRYCCDSHRKRYNDQRAALERELGFAA
jgi:hypothetical protein